MKQAPTISQVPIKETITNIACGYRHTVAVHDKHRVWSWGLNYHGQTGHGNGQKEIWSQRLIHQ